MIRCDFCFIIQVVSFSGTFYQQAMDPLQEIPRDKWPDLRNLYESNWPQEVEGYCFIDTHISCPGLTESFNFKIYSPEQNIHNGIVAVSDLNRYEVAIYPVNENLEAIEKALLSTSVIDWNRPITVPSVKPDVLKSLRRVCEKLGIAVNIHDGVYKHLLHKDSSLYEINYPPNTYVGPLKPEYITIVNETWTYCGATSYQFFEKLMKNNFSYVLYSSDHQPLAWIHVSEYGTFSHLYCLEKHRRNGYAELITKVAVNDLLQKGRHILAYTLEENYKPQKLFIKLGFERVGQVSWVFLSKNNDTQAN